MSDPSRTCFFMREPFIWSHTPGSREELATALTCDTALKNKKKVLVTKKYVQIILDNQITSSVWFSILPRVRAGDRAMPSYFSSPFWPIN